MKKIAIQGVAGAFHDEAAQQYFGTDITLQECDTFWELCNDVSTGKVDYGIMAIENTIAGSLLQNYGYLDEFRLHIIGEVYLRIRMNLMALPDVKMSDLRHVKSHPIAIRQCSDFLSKLPAKIKVSEAVDTAESAKIIKEGNLTDTAAIASKGAAKLYGLNILNEGIESDKQNYTRFIVLSHDANIDTKSNKATISFETRHKIGALAKALTVFSDNNINLTKIQSVPILGKPYQYAFHLDIEWDNVAEYNKAISDIMYHITGLTVYGEYKKGIIPSAD